VITAPFIDQEKWVCTCGYANPITDAICPICAKKKSEITAINEADTTDIVLAHLMDSVVLNTNETLDVILDKYTNSIQKNYGIDAQELYQHLDIDVLHTKQQEMIDQAIYDYIQTHSVVFSDTAFEQCMDHYCAPVLSEVVTKDRVLEKLDMHELKSNYSQYMANLLTRKKQRKKRCYLLLFCMLLMIGLFIAYKFYTRPIYDGLDIYFSYENRKTLCDASHEYVSMDNITLAEYMKEHALCRLSFDDFPEKGKPESGVTVIEAEDKLIRPLDENHVLIQESEKIDDHTEKVYQYFADLSGKMVYGFPDEDYKLITYENGNKVEEVVYVEGTMIEKYRYSYKNGSINPTWIRVYALNMQEELELYQVIKCEYENNKIQHEYIYDSETAKKWLYHKEYDYEDDTNYRINTFFKDYYGTLELIEADQIMNGLTIKHINEESLFKEYYDKNGIKGLELERESYSVDLDDNTYWTPHALNYWNYYYDYDQGILYKVNYQENEDSHLIINDVRVMSIRFMSDDIRTLTSFEEASNEVDVIYNDEM